MVVYRLFFLAFRLETSSCNLVYLLNLVVNCKINEFKLLFSFLDEFNLARRSLRNNSTSSLESISSASSSRSSSYRGTTPVPQQYDGMDSPRLALDDDNDVVNPTNHNTTEKTEKDVNTSTISDDPSTNPSAALSSSTSASSALKGSPVNDEATNNVRNNDENK